MKKSYIETMNHIYPTTEQKNKMFENIFEAVPSKKSHRIKFRYMAAAIAACIAFSSMAVFADEIKSTFYNLLGKSEVVSDRVLNDIYTDTDGHVTMTVKELLSDKITTYAIVEYTAHDDKGKEWLDEFLVVHKLDIPRISFTTDMTLMPDINEGGQLNYSFDGRELTPYDIPELSSENTRVFKFYYCANDDSFGTECVDFRYPLSNKWENHAIINVSQSINIKDIKIDGELLPGKYYKPMGVKISPLTLMIYAENCGYYESGPMPAGGYYQRLLQENEKINSLYLIMKDGKRYEIISSEERTEPLPENETIMTNTSLSMSACDRSGFDYDLSIYSSAFKDYMDITQIDGIELDGVYYSLGEYLQ